MREALGRKVAFNGNKTGLAGLPGLRATTTGDSPARNRRRLNRWRCDRPFILYFAPLSAHQRRDQWLTWAKRLQAIVLTGLHFSEDDFNLECYTEGGGHRTLDASFAWKYSDQAD
jgi:hypothetical protein